MKYIEINNETKQNKNMEEGANPRGFLALKCDRENLFIAIILFVFSTTRDGL